MGSNPDRRRNTTNPASAGGADGARKRGGESAGTHSGGAGGESRATDNTPPQTHTRGSRQPLGKVRREEVYVISVAAELAGLHAQTLRTYDRMGLVTPDRTRGGGRRYSPDDIEMLREIQKLSHDDGVNLAGIRAIIDLKSQVDELQAENHQLRERLARLEAQHGRSRGEIVHVPRSTAVVMWEPGARRRKDRRDRR